MTAAHSSPAQDQDLPASGSRGGDGAPSQGKARGAGGARRGRHAAPRRRAPLSRRLLEWVVIIAIAVGCAFGIKAYLIQAFFIPSGSMIPTLKIGNRILVDKLSYDLHSIHRGDIVVFRKPPTDTGDPQVQDLVKRVVGLPGDRISSAPDGHVLINGKPLPEPYLQPYHRAGPGAGIPIRPQVVPPGHYFVMGDNRNDSKDSRYFGPISGSLVVGRVVLRIWPVTAIHVF